MPTADRDRQDQGGGEDRDPLLRHPWDDAPDDGTEALRPVWADLPDETTPLPQSRSDANHPRRGDPSLLVPLAAAQDSLARLDARAEAAADPVRAGIIARLALREAAGWLAARHAWVHPHDLALRAQNLAGRFDTAAQIARPRAALPNTISAMPGGWDDPADFSALVFDLCPDNGNIGDAARRDPHLLAVQHVFVT